MQLNEIIDTVKNQFQAGPPNGNLLGWDELRCDNHLKDIQQSIKLQNWTSFDYSFCNTYELRIEDSHKKLHWKLTVNVSFIVPTFILYWSRYKKSSQEDKLGASFSRRLNIQNEIKQRLEKAGYFELPEQWYNHKVEGVELELSGTDNVNLGKCLFRDFDV